MTVQRDARYLSLIDQIQSLKRDQRSINEQIEYYRLQRKNSVGYENVQAANARSQEAHRTWEHLQERIEELGNQVNSSYGHGPHNW